MDFRSKAISRLVIVLIAVVVLVVAAIAYVVYLNISVPSKEEIVIGATVCDTGWASYYGADIRAAYEIWEADVNARGGILGMPVKLILYDDESTADVAISLYEKLITLDKVDLIIGPYSSTLMWAVAPIAEKYHMPILSPWATSDNIYEEGWEYVFCDKNTGPATGKTQAGYLLSLRPAAETIAYITLSEAWPMTSQNYMRKFASEGGLDTVYDEEFPSGTKDFTSMILKIKEAAPDTISLCAWIGDGILFVNQMKALDLNVKAFFFDYGVETEEWTENLGKDGDYVSGSALWTPELPEEYFPGTEEFTSKFVDKTGRTPSLQAAGGYGVCSLLEQAVKGADTLDPEKVRDFLVTIDTRTLLGRVKFGELTGTLSGKSLKQVNLYPYVGVGQRQNGFYETVYPMEFATAFPVYPIPTWAERAD